MPGRNFGLTACRTGSFVPEASSSFRLAININVEVAEVTGSVLAATKHRFCKDKRDVRGSHIQVLCFCSPA